MLSIIQFKDKQPTDCYKKFLFIITTVATFLISFIFIYTYVINSPVSEIPMININTEDNINYDD